MFSNAFNALSYPSANCTLKYDYHSAPAHPAMRRHKSRAAGRTRAQLRTQSQTGWTYLFNGYPVLSIHLQVHDGSCCMSSCRLVQTCRATSCRLRAIAWRWPRGPADYGSYSCHHQLALVLLFDISCSRCNVAVLSGDRHSASAETCISDVADT